jgi:hypothetical protein
MSTTNTNSVSNTTAVKNQVLFKTFKSEKYFYPCIAYAYGGCVEGKCPNNYKHVNFCVHCANDDCKFGDECQKPQAVRISSEFWKVDSLGIVYRTKKELEIKGTAKQTKTSNAKTVYADPKAVIDAIFNVNGTKTPVNTSKKSNKSTVQPAELTLHAASAEPTTVKPTENAPKTMAAVAKAPAKVVICLSELTRDVLTNNVKALVASYEKQFEYCAENITAVSKVKTVLDKVCEDEKLLSELIDSLTDIKKVVRDQVKEFDTVLAEQEAIQARVAKFKNVARTY